MRFFLAGIMQGSHTAALVHDQDYRLRIKGLLEAHFPGADVYDPRADHANSIEYDETMLDEGLEYDSSLFPMGKNDPRGPFFLDSRGGAILEVPPMPVRVGRLFWSLASGISLRLFPWALYRALLRHRAKRTGYVHVYLHPWEFSARPRNRSGLAIEKRAYYNLGRRGAYAKLRRLVGEIAFASIAENMESIRKKATETRGFDEITYYRVPKAGLFGLLSGGIGALSHSARR